MMRDRRNTSTGDPVHPAKQGAEPAFGGSVFGLPTHLFNALVIAVPLMVLYSLVLIQTGNEFTYTLDDPYIHLAVAKQIMAGGYGVNAGEFSAPSSSILWPFILAPFYLLPPVFEAAPLIINSICLFLSGAVLFRIFGFKGNWTGLFITLIFLFAFNLYGLVFTGMEHSLQILFVLVVATGLLNPDEALAKGNFRRTFYASLILLPAIRYEGLAITLPVVILMVLRGDRKAAILSGLAAIGMLAGFSIFLFMNGVGFLPSSVLVKSSHGEISGILANVIDNLKIYWWLLALVCIYCVRLWRDDRSLSGTLLLVSLLHFAFGKAGWFGRYEVYYVLFVSIFLFRSLIVAAPAGWIAALLMPLLFYSLTIASILSPRAASNIRNQHGVMASIARELGEGVAVNDLGMVSLRGGVYVLDLWGLGSIEALEKRRSGADPQWASDLMRRKGVEYAMVYDELVPRPSDWIKVGELRLTEKRVTPASDTVSFYALSPGPASRFASVLKGVQADMSRKGFEIRINE